MFKEATELYNIIWQYIESSELGDYEVIGILEVVKNDILGMMHDNDNE